MVNSVVFNQFAMNLIKFNMSSVLLIGLLVVIATAHNITYIEVPRYGDPRALAVLVCQYVFDKKDPPLHSVKWYRGKNEIFRYSPAEEPNYLTFNTSMSAGITGDCDKRTCSIKVKLPQTYNTRFSFTCEVSTEGPRFEIVKQTRSLAVAVILKADPVISGVPRTAQLGDDVLVNCTTGPAMPPANIVWFVDGKPEKTEPWLINNTQVSSANEDGLRSSWRPLHIKVTTTKGSIELRCEATQPTWPPYVRKANTTIVVVRSPHLSMFTSSGSSIIFVKNKLIAVVCLVVHISSKYS